MGICFLYKRGGGFSGGGAVAVKTLAGSIINITDGDGSRFKGLRIFGKTTQDGTPTPDAPVPLESVGDDGGVAVTVCGKNLFDCSVIATGTQNGVTVTNNGDGSFTLSKNVAGAFNTSKTYRNENAKKMFPPGTYTLSLGLESGAKPYPYCYVNFANSAGNLKELAYEGSTFTLTKDMIESDGFFVRVGFYNSATTTTTGETIYPMLRMSGDDTFELYKAQTVAVSTPNGLPGIPVSSGGNYTDENGQQWVCDEVDFNRGVYVKRIGTKTLSKANTWAWNTMHSCSYAYVPGGKITGNDTQSMSLVSSNKYVGTSWTRIGSGYADAEYHCAFIYGISQVGFYDKDCASVADFLAKLGDNSIEVQYVLNSYTETTLTAEQLAAYAALHTNYPNTTIFNDAGAWMEATYTPIGG